MVDNELTGVEVGECVVDLAVADVTWRFAMSDRFAVTISGGSRPGRGGHLTLGLMQGGGGNVTVVSVTVAVMTSIPPPRPALPDSERQAILSQAVATSVVKGFRVESQTPHHAVLVTGRRTNHTLHAIITLFSCGAWGLVWFYLGMTRKEKRVVLQVDANGKVMESS